MDYEIRRPIAVRRIVGLCVAVVLGGIACWAGYTGHQLQEDLLAHSREEPLQSGIDLSREGVTRLPFTQTWAGSHGERIVLTRADGASARWDELLDGLAGRIDLLDEKADSVFDIELSGAYGGQESASPECELAIFHPPPLGRYILSVQVDKPAARLAGVPQVVAVRYMMCGLEEFPASIMKALAVISGLPALLVGGLVLRGLIRYGWRRKPPPPPGAAPGDASE